MSQPGQVFQDPYQYDPRFSWGQWNIKIVSFVADEDIPTGVVVQIKPGTETIRVARDNVALVGISVFDPHHHTTDVVYNKYDMVPVMRIGKVWSRFLAALPPFRDPFPLESAFFYVDTGVMTTDTSVAARLAGANFTMPTKEFYPGTSGSPAADVPYPVPPIPTNAVQTNVGGSVLVELNLG